MIHYLPHDQQVQFDRFDVGVEVSPDECPGLRRPLNLGRWTELYAQGWVKVWLEVSSKYFQESLLWQRNQVIDSIVGAVDQTPILRHPRLLCVGILVFLWPS